MRWNVEGHQNIQTFSSYIVYTELHKVQRKFTLISNTTPGPSLPGPQGLLKPWAGSDHAELPALKSTNDKAGQDQTVSDWC